MAFPPSFLDELRARLPLAAVIGRRVKLVNKGREWGGLCPFHNEKSPSFYVNEDKGFFHCFGCGAHGDVIGFAMRSQGLGFMDAIEALAGEAGLDVPKPTPQERAKVEREKGLAEVMEAAANHFAAQLQTPAGAGALAYLTGRGLDREAIGRFRLGYAAGGLKAALMGAFGEALLLEGGLVRQPEDGRGSYDYFRDRVIFPILDRLGRVVAFGGRVLGDAKPKYLNSPETPLFSKGRMLYGLNWARAGVRDGAELVVTEGYMDVIALQRAGFPGAVAPLGTALTEEQLEEIWRLVPEPILCFDGDAAGQRAAARAIERALPLLKRDRTLRFVTLPEAEDPDSLIRRFGPSRMEGLLRGAKGLAETILALELARRPSDTPEREADLAARLDARAGAIADREVARLYRDFFRNRLFERRRALRGQRRGGPKPVLRAPPMPDPGVLLRRREELLLALVLRRPALLEVIGEELGGLDLTAPDLDKLRRAIINVHASAAGLDVASLRDHLTTLGFARDVEALSNPRFLDHAGFARSDDGEVMLAAWRQILGFWRDQRAGATELEAVIGRFERDAEGGLAQVLALPAEAERRRLEETIGDDPA